MMWFMSEYNKVYVLMCMENINISRKKYKNFSNKTIPKGTCELEKNKPFSKYINVLAYKNLHFY